MVQVCARCLPRIGWNLSKPRLRSNSTNDITRRGSPTPPSAAQLRGARARQTCLRQTPAVGRSAGPSAAARVWVRGAPSSAAPPLRARPGHGKTVCEREVRWREIAVMKQSDRCERRRPIWCAAVAVPSTRTHSRHSFLFRSAAGFSCSINLFSALINIVRPTFNVGDGDDVRRTGRRTRARRRKSLANVSRAPLEII